MRKTRNILCGITRLPLSNLLPYILTKNQMKVLNFKSRKTLVLKLKCEKAGGERYHVVSLSFIVLLK